MDKCSDANGCQMRDKVRMKDTNIGLTGANKAFNNFQEKKK